MMPDPISGAEIIEALDIQMDRAVSARPLTTMIPPFVGLVRKLRRYIVD